MRLHVFNYLPDKRLHILNHFVVICPEPHLWLEDAPRLTLAHGLRVLFLLLLVPHCLQLGLLDLLHLLGFNQRLDLLLGQELVLARADLADIGCAVVSLEEVLDVD